MVKPNEIFKVWSPDDVAECLSGIPDTIYRKIWNEIVPLYNKEDIGEWNDCFSSYSLTKYWDHFTEEEQKTLNRLAEKEQMINFFQKARY